jgi:hypothetical protein
LPSESSRRGVLLIVQVVLPFDFYDKDKQRYLYLVNFDVIQLNFRPVEAQKNAVNRVKSDVKVHLLFGLFAEGRT